jgi:hypothetical protein
MSLDASKGVEVAGVGRSIAVGTGGACRWRLELLRENTGWHNDDSDGSNPDRHGYGWYERLGCLTVAITPSRASAVTMATTWPWWATPILVGAHCHAIAVGLHEVASIASFCFLAPGGR